MTEKYMLIEIDTRRVGEFSELLEYATEDDIWNDNYEKWLKNHERNMED